MLADFVDIKDISLFVVRLFEFFAQHFAEGSNVFDSLAREHLGEEFVIDFVRCDVRAATDGELNIRFELLGGSSIDMEILFNISGRESLGGIENDFFFSFLANEKGQNILAVFHCRKIERGKRAHATFLDIAVLVELFSLAVDKIFLSYSLGSLERAIALANFFHLTVDVLGVYFYLIERSIHFVPRQINLRHQSGIKIKNKIFIFLEIRFASLFVIRQRAANNIEFFIIEIFIERLTKNVLNLICDNRGLIYTLNQSHRSHSLAETGDRSLFLILFKLFRNLLGIITFGDFNLDKKVQFAQIFS